MGDPEAAVREYPSVLAVAQGYGLDVTNYAAVPGGYLLDAATGRYWLKPFAGSEKELAFVVAASEHLVRRGFPYLTRCLRLRDESPGIRFRRVLFYLVEADHGLAPQLKTVDDLRAVGARLGWLHLAARAFEPAPDLAEIRTEWGSCERVFKERLLDLYDFQETCADRPRRTRFDGLYLEHFNDFVDAAREAVDIVAELPLAQMIAVARGDRQFCHGDFTSSALAVDAHGELTVTDLEMARFDLRATDVAELIRATNEYDVDRATAVLEGYHAAFPLAQEDIRLIEAYLRFPRDCWRAANAYYREGINSRARLSEAIANHESDRRFLASFRRLAEQFPTSSLYLENQTEAELFASPDGFFPPAAFSAGAEPGVFSEVVPDDAASPGEVSQPLTARPAELGDLPYPPLPVAGDDDHADQPLTEAQPPVEAESGPPAARVGRRRTLDDRCLFDEPLPPRRRGVESAFWVTAPEPAEIVLPPDGLPAPEDPLVAGPSAAEPGAEASEEPAAGPAEEPVAEPAEQPVAEPACNAAPAAIPAQPAEPSARKKIVWKFPAPLAKQEDKE